MHLLFETKSSISNNLWSRDLFENLFKDTFIKSETIHRPDIRTLQTTLSCAIDDANSSEADSGAHSGNSSPSKSSSGSSMDVADDPDDNPEGKPSTPASSAASVASFNLAIQGATMAIMRQRHWSHITEFPHETSSSGTSDNPPKSPPSTNLKKNKSDQNLLDDEKSETESKTLWTKLKESVTGNESVTDKHFEKKTESSEERPEVREEDFSAKAQIENVSKPPLKKQNSRFSVTPVAVVLPVVEKPEVPKTGVPKPEVPKPESEPKRPVTRQISRFRVTSISEDPDNQPLVAPVTKPDDVSIVFLEPNQPPDKNKRPSIEIEKSQNIPKIIDQMVSNMQITQE